MTARGTPVSRIVLAHALSATATTITVPLIAGTLYTATHSTAALALASAARMLPFVVLSGAAGRLVDRTDRRRLLVTSSLVRAVLAVLLTLLAAAHGPIALMVALACATAVAATPAYAAAGAAVFTLAGRTDRQRAMTQLTGVETAAWVVGPALGGLLLASAPTWTIPLAAAVIATVSAALITTVDLPPADPQPDLGPRTTMRALLATAPGPVAAAVAVNVAVDATSALLVLLGGDPTQYGLLVAALGTGAAAALLAAPATRTRHLPYYLTATATALLAASQITCTPVRALLLTTAGAGAVMAEAAATVSLQGLTPRTRRGAALGALDQVIVGGALAGTVAGPLAAASLGAPMTIAATAFLLAPLPLLLLRGHRTEQPPPTAPARAARPALRR
ncbi:MFS transporter [Streptacidiphilus sp. EB103A]|uniref:MFS transporter n=1 Tax=Streptacidiphilus sp. EB103A TaxID=3156275 RepID=UPI00351470F6